MTSDILHSILFFLRIFRKKSCRTITFDEFKAALGELARKKYKDKTGEEAEAEVFKLIEGKAPVIAGVTVRCSLFRSRTFTSPLTGDRELQLTCCANFPTESCGLSDGEPPHGHHQVHRVAQGALRRNRPWEGEGRARRRGRHIGLRLRIQTSRVI